MVSLEHVDILLLLLQMLLLMVLPLLPPLLLDIIQQGLHIAPRFFMVHLLNEILHRALSTENTVLIMPKLMPKRLGCIGRDRGSPQS